MEPCEYKLGSIVLPYLRGYMQTCLCCPFVVEESVSRCFRVVTIEQVLSETILSWVHLHVVVICMSFEILQLCAIFVICIPALRIARIDGRICMVQSCTVPASGIWCIFQAMACLSSLQITLLDDKIAVRGAFLGQRCSLVFSVLQGRFKQHDLKSICPALAHRVNE